MPYPPELLNSHEKIVVDNHPHWLYFLEPLLGAIVALFFLAVFGFKTHGSVRNFFVIVLLLVILGFGVWALVRLINWRSVELRRDDGPGDLPLGASSRSTASRSRWPASTTSTSARGSSSGWSGPATS